MRISGLSVGQMLEMVAATSKAGDNLAQSIESIEPLIKRFAAALIEWNLEDEDGTPVPATLEGVRRQEISFVLPLIMKWMSVIADVAPPLPEASPSGETFLEESLQLASASASLPS